MNRDLIAKLDGVRLIDEMIGSVWGAKSYRKAINEIIKLEYKIDRSTIHRLKDVPGIGPGIYNAIDEYINTGDIKIKISEKKLNAFRELRGILGVGPVMCKQLIAQRIYSLAQLRKLVAKKKIKLNRVQTLGLMYYADLNQRMPRTEVTFLGGMVRKILSGLVQNLLFEISGSYRRGLPTSGDIDIICSTSSIYDSELLYKLRDILAEDHNYVETLSVGGSRMTFLYKSPYSQPSVVRQIDILWVEHKHYIPSVLYFTGSGNWNEYMRGVAKSMGYRLNQNGLYRIVNDRQELVEVHSEMDIFNILQIPYRKPEDR